MFRGLWIPSVLALVLVGLVPATLPAKTRAPSVLGPVCRGEVYRSWSFHAGASVGAPAAVAASGQVAVATHDGYLHALSKDGSFLWSYTVQGAVPFGVHAGASERFFAASSTGKIYALEADGRAHWVFSAKVKPERLAVEPSRGLLFFTHGTGLYAVSSRAGVLWSLGLGAPVASELRVDADGAVWLLTRDRRLHRIRTPYFKSRWELTSDGVPELLDVGVAGALLRVGNELQSFTEAGRVPWSRPGVESAGFVRGSAGPEIVALDEQGGLLWLDAENGREIARQSTPALPGAALLAHGERVFVAEPSGRLRVVSRRGPVGECTPSSAPLLQPRFDPEREQVVVTAGNGDVAGIRFSGSR